MTKRNYISHRQARGEKKVGGASPGSWRLEMERRSGGDTLSRQTRRRGFQLDSFPSLFFVYWSPTMDLPSGEKCADFVSP